jgi:hypothetical protein
MKFTLSVISILSISVSICSGVDYSLSELGNDTENWMARATYRWAGNKDLSSPEKAELERYSIGKNYQAKHLSCLLLVKQHLREGKEFSSLPNHIKTNLVISLRDDDINPRHSCNLPSNGDIAAWLLCKRKPDQDLIRLLYNEVSGEDYQSAQYAVEILIKWRDVSKPIDERINQHLICALGDGRGSIGWQTFRTWDLIDKLGKENLNSIVSDADITNEFHCAVLQILCAKHDVNWSAPLETIKEWKAVCSGDVEGWRSATYEDRDATSCFEYNLDHYLASRIRQAALFLTPKITVESDQSTLPERTRRLFETEEKLANAKSSEKHKWVLSWFPVFPQ